MGKYIDADRLKAEIERMRKINRKAFEADHIVSDVFHGRAQAINHLSEFIDSLHQEQPEVDLEKEIEEHVEGMPMSEFTHESEVDVHWDWARKEFRYFFELGLNARKEE